MTEIKIPIYLIEANPFFDINAFLVGEGYTVNNRERGGGFMTVTVEENLNAGQQVSLTNAIDRELVEITYVII